MKSYYKFQENFIEMSGPCFTQYSVKEEFQIKYGSIVETILFDNKRIFYKNEDENNETRERWFIKRQDTKESKQQYDRNELEKINNDKGESLDDGDFFEITKKKYRKIYKQTEKANKTTIGIPKLSWDTMNDSARREYRTLLRQKGITQLLVLFPYVFAATDSGTRYDRRNEMKEESMAKQKKTEILRLPLYEQLEQQIPELKVQFPGLSDKEINKVFKNALKFNTIELATANLKANFKAISESKKK